VVQVIGQVSAAKHLIRQISTANTASAFKSHGTNRTRRPAAAKPSSQFLGALAEFERDINVENELRAGLGSCPRPWEIWWSPKGRRFKRMDARKVAMARHCITIEQTQ